MDSKDNDSIARMFQVIDRCDWEQLPKFFHSDVVYERPGYKKVEGINNLIQFYESERRIESGHHELDSVINSANQAVAMGTFRGSLRNGSTVQEKFADVYTFKSGRIWYRRTYFFRPAI